MISEEHKNREILMTRYLSGEASQEEIIVLQKWLKESESNLTHFLELKNIWDNSEDHIYQSDIDTERSYKQVLKKVKMKAEGTSLWSVWKKIAAILLLPLLIGNLLYLAFQPGKKEASSEPVYNEIYATFGTRSALILSDGSAVWLNSGSSLKYPDRFKGRERTVFLSGEAYFEVKSNPDKPFIVETSTLKVKATGTKFQVSSYNSSLHDEVSLISGNVEVKTNEINGMKKFVTDLDSNQHLSYNRETGITSIINEDLYKYYAWIDGKMIFRNEPLGKVVDKISQTYNVDIELRGSDLKDYCFRATFQDESLEEILKLLKVSSPIDYYEVNRIPLPDGSFSKKKILIYPVNQTNNRRK